MQVHPISNWDEYIVQTTNNIVIGRETYSGMVYSECRRYANEHGTIHTKKQKIKGEFGNEEEVDVFDWYEPDDPDEYKIIIYDHVSLISTERGMTLKQSIDKLSEYCVMLRNRFGFTPVVIQQQALAGESLDAIKEDKLRPTIANTSDSKYCARDCNMALGLFSPYKFEKDSYKGYDITKFRDNIRFLEVLINRGGQQGGLIALYFNGAICDFIELPKPDDKEGLNKWYRWLKDKRTKTTFFSYSLTKHYGKNCSNTGFFRRWKDHFNHHKS